MERREDPAVPETRVTGKLKSTVGPDGLLLGGWQVVAALRGSSQPVGPLRHGFLPLSDRPVHFAALFSRAILLRNLS